MFPGTTDIQHRRAIEALRSGVPNRDAVRALGSSQPRIEDRFRHQLQVAQQVFAEGNQVPGLLISGGFGSGKSHMLEYLKHLALEQNFVCSKVVVSKETPLYDPAKLYRAAIQSAVVPGKRGTALNEIAAGFDFGSSGFSDLFRLLNQGELELNSRFAATLFLFEHIREQEIIDKIVSFWSGDPLRVGELRSWLRGYGEAATYNLERSTMRELFLQRFRFTPRLMLAAGYSGWVLLVDEVELIARYSFRQRAKSYAELARWLGRLDGEVFPGLSVVAAITSDFATKVLDERNDEEVIPGRLRASGLGTDSSLATDAESGVRLIVRDAVPLQSLGDETIERTREVVRGIHGEAYHWDPPPLDSEQRLITTSMRQHVRRWITEWDFKRLDPQYAVNMLVKDLAVDYGELPALEVQTEGHEEAESGGREGDA